MKPLLSILAVLACWYATVVAAPTPAFVITPIPDQYTVADAQPLAVPIQWGGLAVNSSVTWSFRSSNPAVVDPRRILVTRGGPPNRIVSSILIRPESHAHGITRIEVEALGVTTSFLVTVAPRAFAADVLVGRAREDRPLSSVDWNLDGRPDLIQGTNAFVWDGTSNFRSVPEPVDGGSKTVRWVDFNGDGLPDALLNGALVRIGFRMPGSDEVPEFVFGLPGTSFAFEGNVEVADIDGDGDLDLMIAPGPLSLTGQNLVVGINDGHGRFDTQFRLPISAMGGLALADMNNDGSPDLIVRNATGAAIHLNAGAGVFSTNAIPIDSLRAGDIGVVDMDGDGWLDVWTKASDGFTVRRREATWYREVFHLDAGLAALMVRPAWGDFDGNGFVDLVAPSLGSPIEIPGSVVSSRWLQLYLNDGSTHLDPRGVIGVIYTNAPSTVQVVAGDFDGDGTLDVVDAQRGYANGIRLHRNETWPAPPLSRPPIGLDARWAGGTVRFRWDTLPWEESGAAPTFNLRVGTVPGGNDIVPSMALPTGTRWVSEVGNAGFRHEKVIDLSGRDLPKDGKLYWSVQQLDPSYRGGPWAAEQVLELSAIPNLPPQIQPTPLVEVLEDHPVNVRMHVEDDHTPIYLLKIEARSEDETLLPTDEISVRLDTSVLDWDNTFILSMTPALDRHGTGRVRVTVSDFQGLSSDTWVDVSVTSVPDAPRSEPAGFRRQYTLDGLVHEEVVSIIDPENPEGAITVTYLQTGAVRLPAGAVKLVHVGGRWLLRVDAFGARARTYTGLFRLVGTGGLSSEVPVEVEFLAATSPDGPPTLRSYTLDGRRDLRVNGAPGSRWAVEQSADLNSWVEVSTVTIDSNGLARDVGPAIGESPAAYLRLRRLE